MSTADIWVDGIKCPNCAIVFEKNNDNCTPAENKFGTADFKYLRMPTQLVPGHHYGQLVQYLDKNLSIPKILENPIIDNNIDKKLNTFLVLIAVFLDFLIYHLKSGKIDCSFALQKGLVTSHRSKFNLLHGVCSRWATAIASFRIRIVSLGLRDIPSRLTRIILLCCLKSSWAHKGAWVSIAFVGRMSFLSWKFRVFLRTEQERMDDEWKHCLTWRNGKYDEPNLVYVFVHVYVFTLDRVGCN